MIYFYIYLAGMLSFLMIGAALTQYQYKSSKELISNSEKQEIAFALIIMSLVWPFGAAIYIGAAAANIIYNCVKGKK